MRRTLLVLTVGVLLGTLLVPRLSPSHLIAGKPKGTAAQQQLIAKRNLAHANGACRAYKRILAGRHPRSHCGALPWLEQVLHRVTLFGRASSSAMNWWLHSGAQCVKSNEGAWTSNTGNGYFGGFQADLSFQRAYGPEFYARWGTANRWPPWAQITMAYRGWLARGWHPWPTTSRMCGLR